MNNIVLPGCSPPEKIIFAPNSTFDNFFKRFDELTRSFSLKSTLFITVLYFVFNIFHLLILTRPAMRSLSVSREMILIALCGVMNGVTGILKNVVEIIDNQLMCLHSYYYYVLMLVNFLIFQILNQIIIWEIVYITFLRATVILHVRHGIKTKTLKQQMRLFIHLLFTVFVANHIARFFFHKIEEVLDRETINREMRGKSCEPGKMYTIASIIGNCLGRISLTISGITSLIIPMFIMLIFSIFLIFELRTSKSPSSTSPESSNRHSTAAHALLLFLCFYTLAELPYALLFGVGLYNPADFEQLDEYVYSQVDVFIYANMCLGILVYCLMSSQYRSTVSSIFLGLKTATFRS